MAKLFGTDGVRGVAGELLTAELAVALGRGEQAPSGIVNGKTDNGKKQVPSVLLTPVAVTADKVQDTIVKDGFWKVSEICTGEFKAACDKNGIK